MIIGVVLFVLQRELLSDKWSSNVFVNVVFTNSAYEIVRAGQVTLASHLGIFARLVGVSVYVALH